MQITRKLIIGLIGLMIAAGMLVAIGSPSMAASSSSGVAVARPGSSLSTWAMAQNADGEAGGYYDTPHGHATAILDVCQTPIDAKPWTYVFRVNDPRAIFPPDGTVDKAVLRLKDGSTVMVEFVNGLMKPVQVSSVPIWIGTTVTRNGVEVVTGGLWVKPEFDQVRNLRLDTVAQPKCETPPEPAVPGAKISVTCAGAATVTMSVTGSGERGFVLKKNGAELKRVVVVGTSQKTEQLSGLKTDDKIEVYSVGSSTSLATATVPAPCVTPPPPPSVSKVRGSVKKLDKCGSNNFVFAKKVKGLHYVLKGKVLREGKWLKVKGKTVTVKLVADGAHFKVTGKSKFILRFPNSASCGKPPTNVPNTGM